MEDTQSPVEKWDEVLINAWGRNPSVYSLAIKFLQESGISFSSEQDKHSTVVLVEKFAELGIFARSPKTYKQLCMNVRPFFAQCFPEVHALMVKGEKAEAVRVFSLYALDFKDDVKTGRSAVPLYGIHTGAII